jgi:hypothetical protein
MKTFLTLIAAISILAGVALAAAIDGKWVSEQKMNRGGEEMTITRTFELKSDGSTLTGTVATAMAGRDPMPAAAIKDGKLDGNKFSFKVTSSGPNGEMTTAYEGTVEGDTMKGTSVREGGQGQPRPFEAKKK